MIFDTISNIENYKGLGKVYAALEFLSKTDFSQMELGKYILDDDNVFYMVQSYNTKEAGAKTEAHKAYIDIQYIVSGSEAMEVCDVKRMVSATEYDPEKDCAFFTATEKTTHLALSTGDYAIFFPDDIHKPGISPDENAVFVKKIVAKVRIR